MPAKTIEAKQRKAQNAKEKRQLAKAPSHRPPGVDQADQRLEAARKDEIEKLRMLMASTLEASNRKVAELQTEVEALRTDNAALRASLEARTAERDEDRQARQNIIDNLMQYAGQWVFISDAPSQPA